MYKVLLVDDEQLIRDAISRNMKWEENGFDLIGTAENGREAVTVIEQELPDLVLTDICMPVMDGIALSAFLYENYPQIKVVIISGYDDFAYAKKAIQYEVTNYILKPVTAQELAEELEKVKEKIEESRGNAPVLRSHYLSQIVEEGIVETDIERHLGRLKIELSGVLQCVVIAEECSEFWIKEVQRHPRILWFRDKRSRMVFIVSGESTRDVNETIASYFLRTEEDIQVIAGEIVAGVEKWPSSYQSAVRVLGHKFLFEGQKIIRAIDLEHKKAKCSSRFMDQIGHLILLIKMNQVEEIALETTRIFGDLKRSGKDNRQLLVIIQNMGLMISLSLREILDEKEFRYKQEDFGLRIRELPGLQQIEQEFLKYCESIAGQIAEGRENGGEKQAVLAMDYIEKNYMKAGMSLNKVCDYLGVSVSYFSAIFKNTMGETFIEALTRIRMEKARVLLSGTDMKNYEVALEVGYQDPHYFSALFKKHTGMTPKEYARKLKEKCG